ADYLAYYAEHYDTVEVDSTFYHSPSVATARGWRDKTPEGFGLSLKVPQTITHEKRLQDCGQELNAFLTAARALEGKRTLEGRRQLEQFLESRGRDLLRGLRAVEALEQSGTVEARRVLQMVAAGATDPQLAGAAGATLRRLAGLPRADGH